MRKFKMTILSLKKKLQTGTKMGWWTKILSWPRDLRVMLRLWKKMDRRWSALVGEEGAPWITMREKYNFIHQWRLFFYCSEHVKCQLQWIWIQIQPFFSLTLFCPFSLWIQIHTPKEELEKELGFKRRFNWWKWEKKIS
jgi:hypothetical protein